jgi:hypothetical protein
VEPQPNTTQYWRCLNCGQVYFGDCPPDDLCPFCNDLTTWTQHAYAENSAPHASTNGHPASPDAATTPSDEEQQLPLFRDEK